MPRFETSPHITSSYLDSHTLDSLFGLEGVRLTSRVENCTDGYLAGRPAGWLDGRPAGCLASSPFSSASSCIFPARRAASASIGGPKSGEAERGWGFLDSGLRHSSCHFTASYACWQRVALQLKRRSLLRSRALLDSALCACCRNILLLSIDASSAQTLSARRCPVPSPSIHTGNAWGVGGIRFKMLRVFQLFAFGGGLVDPSLRQRE